MGVYVSLENVELFPSWSSLPFVRDKQHCYLAEIQGCDGLPRYRTIVKDREGELSIVAFYPDSYEGFDFKLLKKGHTLAIMNAQQHHFVDGTHGVRVEDVDNVCVFHAGLEELQGLVPDVATYAVDNKSEEWKCHGCEASKPVKKMSRCGQCKVYAYCSKECQTKGWTEKGHKSTCKVLRGPKFLSLLKLDFSSVPASDPFTFQRR